MSGFSGIFSSNLLRRRATDADRHIVLYVSAYPIGNRLVNVLVPSASIYSVLSSWVALASFDFINPTDHRDVVGHASPVGAHARPPQSGCAGGFLTLP